MGSILVVDDQEMIRRALRVVLEKDGHAVVDAGDGNQAMRALRSQPFDLVITDIVMPDKEGLAIISEIRHLYPALPVFAMSGGMSSGTLDVLDLAKRLGACRTFSKPFSMASIVLAVRQQLTPRPTV